jgi:acyl carrier protein
MTDFIELENRIRLFLETELGVPDADLTRESALVSSGLLDSAGLVRLAALLEEAIGITIPDRDVNPNHFDTLAKIDAYLRGRLAD